MRIKSILQNKHRNEAEKQVVEKLRHEAHLEKISSSQSKKYGNEVSQFLDLIKDESNPDRKIKKNNRNSTFYLPRLAFATFSLCIVSFLIFKGFEKPEENKSIQDLSLIEDLVELEFQPDLDFVKNINLENFTWEKPSLDLNLILIPMADFGSLFTDIEIIPPLNLYFDPVQNLPNRLTPSEFWDFKKNTREEIKNFKDSIPFLEEIYQTNRES
ncbi:MAG: hypothetical protein HN548_04690 [Opitutae bacterium]|jgi:hypothetical protein|nr:hypothetical protein [Opitutae bacterium]MBT5716215.1 hypothetical protein [Opitutae bacterium]